MEHTLFPVVPGQFRTGRSTGNLLLISKLRSNVLIMMVDNMLVSCYQHFSIVLDIFVTL